MHRPQRFSSTLQNSLAEVLLNDINNRELQEVSISRVTVSDDLRKASVFITSYGGTTDRIIKEIQKARGFIRRSLAKRMYLKYVPDLEFFEEDIKTET